jgi:hypothetical protein
MFYNFETMDQKRIGEPIVVIPQPKEMTRANTSPAGMTKEITKRGP